MAKFTPRKGQWCKFSVSASTQIIGAGALGDLPQASAALIGAQKAGDKIVGIYQRAGKDPIGVEEPEQLIVAQQNLGTNLRFIHDSKAHLVAFAPGTVSGLEPVIAREELPAARLPDASWVPQP